MPLLFAPTIGAPLSGRHWYIWVRCPPCRTAQAVDHRALDRRAVVTSLNPALSCRSCRPNAPFAELLRRSKISNAYEVREAHTRRVLGA
jgi:hypothetical protein